MNVKKIHHDTLLWRGRDIPEQKSRDMWSRTDVKCFQVTATKATWDPVELITAAWLEKKIGLTKLINVPNDIILFFLIAE